MSDNGDWAFRDEPSNVIRNSVMSDETLTMHPDGNRFSFTTSATLLLTLMMLVLQSRAEDLVVDLVRGHQAPKPIASVRQLDVRAGDVLRLKSEFGDVYELSVASARRSALGNKIITGHNNTGARLTMVVTSDGVVQGSMRDAGQTFRITQNGDGFAWHAVDPYMAKPVDARAVKAPRRRAMMEMKQYDMDLMSTRSAPMSDVADETL
jgi:hypothetical protein